MKSFSNKITLSYSKRGLYSLDPSLGCYYGLKEGQGGCYNDCYAVNIAKRYGYDFSRTINRHFKSLKHLLFIKSKINKIQYPFIRMGTMGDPSYDWEHTIHICELIQNEIQLNVFRNQPKQIIIITKHWNKLNNKQLNRLLKLNICINTSVSALDNHNLLKHRLIQYERIKPYCKSILRIVSCNFNIKNKRGRYLYEVQKEIFNNYKVIDTIFRVSKKNKLVTKNIINIENFKFLKKRCIVSIYNKNTYFGNCNNCLDMCGYNIN